MITTREMTMHQALAEALLEEMERDESIFVWGEAVKTKYAFDSPRLVEKFPSRFFNLPIAEAAIVGISIGASLAGMKPVVDLAFNDLCLRAMDEICNQAAKIRFFSGGQARPCLVIKTEYSIPISPQQSQFLEGLFMHTPGIRIAVPSNPADAKGLMKTALRGVDPVLFFEERRLRGPVPVGSGAIPFGEAKVVREGSDITVVTYSAMTQVALEVAKQLEEEASVEVVDLRTLNPLDRKTIVNSVRKTRRMVAAEQGCRTCGVGAELVAVVMEQCFDSMKRPVERVAAEDSTFPATKALGKYVTPGAEQIAAAIKRSMSSV